MVSSEDRADTDEGESGGEWVGLDFMNPDYIIECDGVFGCQVPCHFGRGLIEA